MKLPNLFKPKPTKPTIESYGQPTIEPEQLQSLMEWLFSSLMAVWYCGKSHIIWYGSNSPNSRLKRIVKKAMRRGEPVFLYSCDDSLMPLPQRYYWRIMEEHLSMRVYQLEVKE